MDKSKWIQIKKNSPLALKSCRGHFERRDGEKWRAAMKNKDELLEFFRRNGIKIETYWEMGKVKSRLVIENFMDFKEEEDALEDGIIQAFKLLDKMEYR